MECKLGRYRDGHGFAHSEGRSKLPLRERFLRLRVEPFLKSANDSNAADMAVRLDDAVEHHSPIDTRAHGAGRVLGMKLTNGRRQLQRLITRIA